MSKEQKVMDKIEDTKKILKEIKENFPSVSVAVRVPFDKWKLNDLRLFLKLVNNYKGHSKLKKDALAVKALESWDKHCSSSYFTPNDIDDEELLNGLNTPPQPKSSEPQASSSTSVVRSEPVNHGPPSDPSRKYPKTVPGMAMEDFKKWNLAQLQDYLADRCINKTGNKAKLVENVYGAYLLNLPVTASNPQQELEELKSDYKQKLILENGMVNLPCPRSLSSDTNWAKAPANLPDVLYRHVNEYLVKNDGGKAFQGGKSLFESKHLFNVMVHSISPNVRYCFAQGLCYPEQKFKSKDAYVVWVCLHKDTGEVITGDCNCAGGLVLFFKGNVCFTLIDL